LPRDAILPAMTRTLLKALTTDLDLVISTHLSFEDQTKSEISVMALARYSIKIDSFAGLGVKSGAVHEIHPSGLVLQAFC
jgi:hypothetical protein